MLIALFLTLLVASTAVVWISLIGFVVALLGAPLVWGAAGFAGLFVAAVIVRVVSVWILAALA